MKQCSIFNKGLCLRLYSVFGEENWVGAEQCSIYKKLNNTTGIDLCRRILEGNKQCQMKI